MVKEPSRFYPGTCHQLERNLDEVLHGLLTNVAICKDSGLWIVRPSSARLVHLGAAVKRIFAEFLMKTPHCAGAVWAHGLCWTDRFVLRLFGAEPSYEETDYLTYGMQEPITMKFLPSACGASPSLAVC